MGIDRAFASESCAIVEQGEHGLRSDRPFPNDLAQGGGLQSYLGFLVSAETGTRGHKVPENHVFLQADEVIHLSGEGRFAITAAKKYDRIVQIGTNQHSCAHYRKAVEIIQSGRLGNIMEVKVWDTEHYGSLGPRPADRDPPPELDWDFYVGPSPLRPYNPCYHAFDWFKDFGGGFQVAWGVHHYDIVHWAMGVHWPKTVMANGGNYAGFHDCREWPDTFSAIVEYGPGPVAKDGFLLQYTARPAKRSCP